MVQPTIAKTTGLCLERKNNNDPGEGRKEGSGFGFKLDAELNGDLFWMIEVGQRLHNRTRHGLDLFKCAVKGNSRQIFEKCAHARRNLKLSLGLASAIYFHPDYIGTPRLDWKGNNLFV